MSPPGNASDEAASAADRMRPKYQELRDQIRDMIDESAPGHQLPSERELCDRFGVARETLRRALDELARDGYVHRRHGAGTFVARPKIAQQFHLQSFTADMASRGMASASKVLWHRRRSAGARLGAQLKVSPREEILTVQRLRLADGEPMALELLSVPAALVPGMDPEDLATESFYRVLGQRYGVVLTGGSQTMEPTVVDAEESDLLTVPPFSPALLVERVTWTEEQRPVEFVRSVYRGDRYKFHLDLSTSGGTIQ